MGLKEYALVGSGDRARLYPYSSMVRAAISKIVVAGSSPAGGTKNAPPGYDTGGAFLRLLLGYLEKDRRPTTQTGNPRLFLNFAELNELFPLTAYLLIRPILRRDGAVNG